MQLMSAYISTITNCPNLGPNAQGILYILNSRNLADYVRIWAYIPPLSLCVRKYSMDAP